MAGVTLGFLKYVLGLDNLAFRKGMTEAERDLVKLQKSFAKKGEEFQKLGKGLSAFVTLPLAGLAAKGIQEAQETAAAMAQVNASLASMGPVAGRTADQLQKAANAFEGASLFEADQVLKDVTATMLTFSNVTGTTFDRAQQASIDLATKFGKGLPEAAVMVGKALQDPIKGLTALNRVGVSFTEQEREQIKAMVEAGNAAGAQQIILAGLEKQVRGSAAAAQNADPWNKLSDSFKSIAESIGTVLLPIIPPLAHALASVANWVSSLDPTTQKWVVGIGAAAAALGPLAIAIGAVIKVIATMGPLVTGLTATWTALQAAFVAVRIAALATLPALTPFLIPLAAITAAVTAGYLAWKNWDKIKPIVQNMVNGVATALRGLITGPIDLVKRKVAEVTNAFRTMYDKVVGHSYVPDMVDLIATHFARLGPVMVEAAKQAAEETTQAFEKLKGDVNTLLNDLFPERAQNQQYIADVKTLDDALSNGIITIEEYNAALVKMNEPPPQQQGPRNPLQEWAASVPQTAEQVTLAFQRIQADGLDRLSDSLAEVILGTKSLKDAAREMAASFIADTIRVITRMLLLKAITSAFGGGFGSGGGVGDVTSSGIYPSDLGFASGGFVRGRGSGTSDSIPALLSNGEFIINAAATRRFLPLLRKINSGALRMATGGWASARPMNDNFRLPHNDRMPNVSIVNNNDFRGADPSTQAALEARIDRMQAELPSTIIGTVQDAKQRFIIR